MEKLETIEINGEEYRIDGDSAYEVAVKNGFKGTEEEWLESLKYSEDGQPSLSIAIEDLNQLNANNEAYNYKYAENLNKCFMTLEEGASTTLGTHESVQSITARFSIKKGSTYQIKVDGNNDRFAVAFANTSDLWSVHECHILNTTLSVYEFKTTGDYNLCYVYILSGNDSRTPNTHVRYAEICKLSNIVPNYLEASFSNKDNIYRIWYENNCRVAEIKLSNKKYRVTINNGNRFVYGFSQLKSDDKKPNNEQLILDNPVNVKDEISTKLNTFYIDNRAGKYRYCYVYSSADVANYLGEVSIEEFVFPHTTGKTFSQSVLYTWNTPTMNEANGNLTADQIIDTYLEPLRKDHPNYITRTNIGKDASNTYDMWEYVFAPASYHQTIWVQSGCHSREKTAVFGLCEFLKYLTTSEDLTPELNYIKNNCRLVVIPIVNPWGISQTNPTDDNNSNGVNLNRDLFSDSKQQETINVLGRLHRYVDNVAFAIDCHTTVNSTYGDYSCVYASDGQVNIPIIQSVISYLANKNITDRIPDLHYMGVQEDSNKYVDYWYNKFKLPCCLTEHADFVWDKNSKYSSICITRSTELIGNMIINHALEKFKLHNRINKYF